ncbi:unnamed protein product [Zymoseptoria tritici ST99CH_1A5]|uniref:asparaginase n=1 Tax=Zymoseptoria tritici ST99CH_1A5 TaxID=1276529 RepID=A0A1Y6LE60_ZYMTR|nr:unnamed protein product [Zymoseptoria tritici ST99CH_1A5]
MLKRFSTRGGSDKDKGSSSQTSSANHSRRQSPSERPAISRTGSEQNNGATSQETTNTASGIYRLLSFVSANRTRKVASEDVNIEQAAYEPSVLLIVAGGTICMQDSKEGLVTSKLFLDECLTPKPLFNDGTQCPTSKIIDEHGVSREAPSLQLPRDRNGANVRCTVLEFNPLLDSSTAHSPTWNQLARCVRSNEANYDAFVICHGTDTLAYTAAALSFMLMPNLDKTVVLTGAQRSMFFADSDGSDNLLGSIVMASHLRIPEVCVYFGHKLLRGTRITKISASSYSGFESPNAGPLATVSETGIIVHWDNLQHPPPAGTPKASKDVVEVDSSRVVVLKIYPGLTAELVDLIFSSPHIKGAVLETFGAGNMPLSIIPSLSKAVQRGVAIVNVTQCLHGSVSDAYEPARKLVEAGIMLGYDMTMEAAYTKMVYLLSCTGLSPVEVGKQLSANIRGELTPPEPTHVASGPFSIAQLPIRVAFTRRIGNHHQTRWPSIHQSWEVTEPISPPHDSIYTRSDVRTICDDSAGGRMIIVGRLSQILFKADRVCAEEWDCEQHIKLIMTDDMYPAHHTGVFALPFLLGDSGFKECRAQAKWFAQSSSTDVPGDPNTNPIVVEFLAFPLL